MMKLNKIDLKNKEDRTCRILQNHNKTPKFTARAVIYCNQGTLTTPKYAPEYHVSYKSDASGWYQEVRLTTTKGEKSIWGEDLQGQRRLIIRQFDAGKTEIKLYATNHRKDTLITLDSSDLEEIIAGYTLMQECSLLRRDENKKDLPAYRKVGKIIVSRE